MCSFHVTDIFSEEIGLVKGIDADLDEYGTGLNPHLSRPRESRY